VNLPGGLRDELSGSETRFPLTQETTMFRKTILAVAATAALGAAALAPTAASAGGYYGHHNHHSYNSYNHYKSYSYRSHYAPAYASYNSDCVWKKRWVESDYGTVVKWVKVCY
jgi:hypothetical protein